MSIALDVWVHPAELSGRQSGTVTTILNACHFMKIVSTSSTARVNTAIPLYMFLQNGSLLS